MFNKDLANKYIKPLYPKPTGLKAKGKLQDNIECILFDVYGTLFISESGDIEFTKDSFVIAQQINFLLERYNINKKPHDLIEDLHGTIRRVHSELVKKKIDYPEVKIDEIWMEVLGISEQKAIRKFAIEFELIANPIFPMPHLKEVLLELKRRKVTMGIISNAQFYTPLLIKFILDSDLKNLGFSSDLIFWSYRFGYAKPSLLLFSKAFDCLKIKGISPEKVLFVGNDMLKDIYPAKEVGFKTALFAGDSRSLRLRSDDPRCKFLSADIIINDLKQLIH